MHEALAKRLPKGLVNIDKVVAVPEAEELYRKGMASYLGLKQELDFARALSLFRQAADKGHGLARGHGHREPVQHDEGPELPAQPVDVEERRAHERIPTRPRSTPAMPPGAKRTNRTKVTGTSVMASSVGPPSLVQK